MGDAEAGQALQFEEAEAEGEGAQGPAPCASCQRLLEQQYFEVGGRAVCPSCRDAVLARLDRGTPGLRFWRSMGLGLGAAALGSALYYAILAATGYEIGLVGIVVGLLVGGAVKRGSFDRGGGRYQALAMILTYCAIVTTYMPAVTKGMRSALKQAAEDASKKPSVPAVAPAAGAGGAALATPTPATGTPSPAAPAAPAEAALPAPAAPAQAAPPAAEAPPMEAPGWLKAIVAILFYGVAFALAFALPVLSFDPMGIAIIAFSLWEAWKLNRRVPVVVRGPFQVAPPAAPAEPASAAAEP